MTNPEMDRHAVKIQALLDRFYSNDFMNRQWLRSGGVQAYFRKGLQPLKDVQVSFLTLANISVRHEHSGLCRAVLQKMEEKLEHGDVDIVFVENVMGDRLRQILDRHGWEVWPQSEPDDGPPTYYKAPGVGSPPAFTRL
jgi:hypothetical protein